jgi:RNA polymerase sigma-70 factor (ECF subfamily)
MASEAASTGSPESGCFDPERLIKEHQAGVWRFLRALGCSPTEAEDLTQETFLAVLQKPFQDYNRTATAAYLRQVARNLLIDSRRRAARTVPATDIASADLDALEAAWVRWSKGRGSNSDASDGGAELLLALRRCLETLTERARQALNLRFRDRLSRAQIAAQLGLSEDGAKNLMQRAKQHLRTCIERSGQVERSGQ